MLVITYLITIMPTPSNKAARIINDWNRSMYTPRAVLNASAEGFPSLTLRGGGARRQEYPSGNAPSAAKVIDAYSNAIT